MDLFGKAFKDFYEGKQVELYIERDDGYLDRQDFSEYFEDYLYFPDVEKKALTHAKGRVLDIGVGAGRVALYLQSLGMEVVGLDISEHALEVSRLRGVKKLIRMSACELQLPEGSFDTAIAFGNNFGLCGTMDRVADMMRRLRRIISEDGVFLAESVDPYNTDKEEHREYHRRNIERGRPPGQVTIRSRYMGQVDDWMELLMVTPGEMASLCADTGWRIEASYPGSPYNVYVLTKS